ncbi:PDZ and LIM domain protein 2 [Python bivittatus]|uniref:PDZ and LIM domain protein 2 n=1 Tax=Python bivittatus TaxID=176946 RepID=A0A9F2KW57_PYTBI|nr:PDZ and LIM domain protein 2 [Python bivittatus]XP_025022647.1 PDZ and LIM domain protein 2 [Python bivittatus]
MSVSVNLTGPAPWGFRITGGRDFRKPIIVSKVIEHGKAALGDLRPGDVIISINGESTSEMLNVEAQNKIKQSSGQLQLQVDRLQQCSPSQTNGESSPEMLAIRFQDVVRTRDNGQNSVRSSYSSPASISPRPSSPYCPSSPGYRPGSPYSPVRSSLSTEVRGEPVMNSRSFQSMGTSLGISEHSPPLQRQQDSSSRQIQEQRNFTHSSESVLPPLNGSPSPGGYSFSNPWEIRKDHERSPSSYNRSYSLDTEPTMHRLEGDSEVYKMMQENRETRAPPRQSSTFRLLQVALELDEKEGAATHFPSQLSPSSHKPVSSSVAGNTQKLHMCEKCNSSITNQAVKIQENRYRHPACYICTDCGLNLKMRGHFWVGEEMYCEKHARQRYQSPGEGGTVLAVYSQS